MRTFKQYIIFSLSILFTCYDELMALDSSCGDWEPYRDEKCFKVLDEVGTEEEAEKICSQLENGSTLITIHSKDEQDILSNLLFKTHKVVDTVWIGAKYSSNKFKWVDDSDLSFTNWDKGSPSNTADKACVQLIPEGSSIGKWVNEPCNKKNLVVCQKMQTWSLSLMQKIVLNSIKNQFPIGFIYVQLPNEKSPIDIWPWMAWNDVSSTYAGVFFRVTGGEAASFGQVQEDNAPRIDKINVKFWDGNKETQPQQENFYNHSIPKGSWSDWTCAGGDKGNCMFTRFQVSSGEVRPRNMAIRIWKRTG